MRLEVLMLAMELGAEYVDIKVRLFRLHFLIFDFGMPS
jgi:hypothetical protein